MAEDFAHFRKFMADAELRLSRLEAAQKEPYALAGTYTVLRTFTPGTTAVERVVAGLITDLTRKGVLR